MSNKSRPVQSNSNQAKLTEEKVKASQYCFAVTVTTGQDLKGSGPLAGLEGVEGSRQFWGPKGTFPFY